MMISSTTALIILLMSSVVIFAASVWRRFRLLRLGKRDNRCDRITERLRSLFLTVLGQRCVLKSLSPQDLSAISHCIMFWGFIVFVISYIILFGRALGIGLLSSLSKSTTFSVFSAFLDILGLLIIGAILWAAFRRYIIRPERLEPSLDAAVILIFIFVLMMTFYIQEGAQIAMTETGWRFSHPIGSAVGSLLIKINLKGDLLLKIATTFWWIHTLVIFGFLIYIPYSKHLHLIASPFNVFFKSLGPRGVLNSIDLESVDIEKGENFGVAHLSEFTWKQLLDLYACAECGRCRENCPATIAGKSLNPQELIKDLKVHLLKSGDDLLCKREGTNLNINSSLIENIVTEDEVWACTNCYSCQEQCPVDIEHVQKIVDLRRNLVLTEGRFPKEVRRTFKNLRTYGDPLGMGRALRSDWAQGLEVKELSEDSKVDILFWVGCSGAFSDMNRKTIVSLTKLFKKAGVNFGVLGKDEKCCGDPARRIGNEYLFQKLAQENIECMKRYGVKKIVTACPHGFNILKHEYPHFGGEFEVFHYTEYILDLIEESRLRITQSINERVTYHDPCYLGRCNGMYEPPRKIVNAIPGINLIEMNRSKEKSFCCGAGGGRFWMQEEMGKKGLNELRIEEAVKTKAEIVITSCPFCLTMLDDGIKLKELEESIKVLDLIELVEHAV